MDRATIPNPPGAPERIAGMVPGVKAGDFLFLSAIRGGHPPCPEQASPGEARSPNYPGPSRAA
jgi:hypothetical protein